MPKIQTIPRYLFIFFHIFLELEMSHSIYDDDLAELSEAQLQELSEFIDPDVSQLYCITSELLYPLP